MPRVPADLSLYALLCWRSVPQPNPRGILQRFRHIADQLCNFRCIRLRHLGSVRQQNRVPHAGYFQNRHYGNQASAARRQWPDKDLAKSNFVL